MAKLTAEQIDVCRTIADSAAKAMRSKRMLRIISGLQDQGFVDYDPFSASASLTDAGRAALQEAGK